MPEGTATHDEDSQLWSLDASFNNGYGFEGEIKCDIYDSEEATDNCVFYLSNGDQSYTFYSVDGEFVTPDVNEE